MLGLMGQNRSGFRGWLWQRFSAVVLLLYILFLGGYCLASSNLDYVEWRYLFDYSLMRFATLLVVLNILIHAWIGLWTVATDYLKGPWLCNGFLGVVMLTLFGMLVWSVQILWGS